MPPLLNQEISVFYNQPPVLSEKLAKLQQALAKDHVENPVARDIKSDIESTLGVIRGIEIGPDSLPSWAKQPEKR